MRFDTLAGTIDVDASTAARFIRAWFRGGDKVTVVATRKKSPNRHHLMAAVYSFEDLVEDFESTRGDEVLNGLVNGADGSQWNLYVQVCPALAELATPFKRGGDENVKCFRGPWVDLDVKESGFSSTEEALNFLRGLEIWPTTVVTTGSGGVHAYWHLTDDLDPKDGRELMRGWYAYLAEEADKQSIKIDDLVDISRMMRLPGTIRWPKEEETLVSAPVELLYIAPESEHVPAEKLREVCGDASKRRYERVKKTQTEDAQRRINTASVAKAALARAGEMSWPLLQAISRVEDLFNEAVSWDEILGSRGWNFIREDRDGRHEWGRPGRFEKSATTDWPESPDMMSLLSSAEDTGLLDLKEAGIALTKYRVALRLWFNDDETEIVNWTLQRISAV